MHSGHLAAMTHNKLLPGLSALCDTLYTPLCFQSEFICDQFRPIHSHVNTALFWQKFFSCSEKPLGHTTSHRPNTFTVCTLSLPDDFSLPLLILPSYRIRRGTSDDAWTMTSTLLPKNNRAFPKHLPFHSCITTAGRPAATELHNGFFSTLTAQQWPHGRCVCCHPPGVYPDILISLNSSPFPVNPIPLRLPHPLFLPLGW